MKMIKYTLVVVICAVAVAYTASVVKRQAAAGVPPNAYVLSAGAEEVLGDIRYTFSCQNRIYGYYADQDNDCKIFHVCLPVPSPTGEGVDETLIFSFFCGNQTVFDQEKLVCVYPEDSIPCQDAHYYYMINENFGKQVWHTTPRSLEEEKRNLG